MKKIIAVLIVLLGVTFSGCSIIDGMDKSGDTYYVKITAEGKKENLEKEGGGTYIDYRYQIKGYNAEGKEQDLDFYANKDRSLKLNAYLKVTYQAKKGKEPQVTSWEEVDKADVPEKAAAILK